MNVGRTSEHETQKSVEKFTAVSFGTCVGHEISVFFNVSGAYFVLNIFYVLQ
jgi:hypothetical protein